MTLRRYILVLVCGGLAGLASACDIASEGSESTGSAGAPLTLARADPPGQPASCTAGVACTPAGEVCRTGRTSCRTGRSTCVATGGEVPNGTLCGSNEVCSNGSCVSCTAGAACTPSGNPCQLGVTSCSTGQSTCLSTGKDIANGTVCGTNEVCSNGSCGSCTAGISCSPSSNPCQTGTTSCSSGLPTCVSTGQDIANGTVCGTNEVCSGGSCVACTAGTACAPSSNPCQTGTTSCSTGVPICVSTGEDVPNGTPCSANETCVNGECTP
jgi:hypothetical protein